MCHSKYFTSTVLIIFHISIQLCEIGTIVISVLGMKELMYKKLNNFPNHFKIIRSFKNYLDVKQETKKCKVSIFDLV